MLIFTFIFIFQIHFQRYNSVNSNVSFRDIIDYIINIYILILLFSLKLSIELNEVISFLFVYTFVYLFIFGCTGFLLLHSDFPQLWWAGTTLHCCTQAPHCSRFSCCGAQALGSQASVVATHGFTSCRSGFQSTGSVFVLQGFSCSIACGIFPDQGLNPCPLHWQVDAYPLHHQGSPRQSLFKSHFLLVLMAHMIKKYYCKLLKEVLKLRRNNDFFL